MRVCVCVNEGEHMRENVDLYSLLFAVVEYAKKKKKERWRGRDIYGCLANETIKNKAGSWIVGPPESQFFKNACLWLKHG